MNNIIPTNCPTCGEFLDWEGVHLVCNGDNCIAKKIVSIAYFYSHKGIKIDGIGEAIVEKLLNNKNCYDVLSTKPWALLDCASYKIMSDVLYVLGLATFSNIIEQVNEVSSTKNMAHFISGLGLPQVSYKTALRLCYFLKSGKLDYHVSSQARQSFAEGAIIYSHAVKEMINFKFAPMPEPAKAVYCITGTLSMSRDEMIDFLEQYNFLFSPAVTRATNYLIVGESPGKTKVDKAKKLNTPMITEAQLMNLLKEYKNE